MKFIFSLMLCMFALPVWADFQTEKAAIEKFEKDVFKNPNNYLPAPPGQLPALKPEFFARLKNDTKSIRYFFILTSDLRLRNRYKLVKPFALHLEAKFDGKALTDQQLDKVCAVVADFILSDSELVIKKAFSSGEASNEYFESNMTKLQDVTFR